MHLEYFMWCKKNMALGDCTASVPGVESGTSESNGVTALHSAHRLYGGDAAAAFLDGGHSRLPPPTEFRARLFLSMSSVIPFLCRIPAGPELADSLPATSHGAQSVCDCCVFCRPVHTACPPAASSSGICRDTGDAQSKAVEVGGVAAFLCRVFSFVLPSNSASAAKATF